MFVSPLYCTARNLISADNLMKIPNNYDAHSVKSIRLFSTNDDWRKAIY